MPISAPSELAFYAQVHEGKQKSHSRHSTTLSNYGNISTGSSCGFRRQKRTKWIRLGVERSGCGKLAVTSLYYLLMAAKCRQIAMNLLISSMQSTNVQTTCSTRATMVRRVKGIRMSRKAVIWEEVFLMRIFCNRNSTK